VVGVVEEVDGKAEDGVEGRLVFENGLALILGVHLVDLADKVGEEAVDRALPLAVLHAAGRELLDRSQDLRKHFLLVLAVVILSVEFVDYLQHL
jgi:phosphoribosyl-ATP pyrophosphohydrolase